MPYSVQHVASPVCAACGFLRARVCACAQLVRLLHKAHLSVVQMRLISLTEAQALRIAALECEDPTVRSATDTTAHEESVAHLTSGPTLVLLLRGENAVGRAMVVAGPTDPAHARAVRPFSFRANFGTLFHPAAAWTTRTAACCLCCVALRCVAWRFICMALCVVLLVALFLHLMKLLSWFLCFGGWVLASQAQTWCTIRCSSRRHWTPRWNLQLTSLPETGARGERGAMGVPIGE